MFVWYLISLLDIVKKFSLLRLKRQTEQRRIMGGIARGLKQRRHAHAPM